MKTKISLNQRRVQDAFDKIELIRHKAKREEQAIIQGLMDDCSPDAWKLYDDNRVSGEGMESVPADIQVAMELLDQAKTMLNDQSDNLEDHGKHHNRYWTIQCVFKRIDNLLKPKEKKE